MGWRPCGECGLGLEALRRAQSSGRFPLVSAEREHTRVTGEFGPPPVGLRTQRGRPLKRGKVRCLARTHSYACRTPRPNCDVLQTESGRAKPGTSGRKPSQRRVQASSEPWDASWLWFATSESKLEEVSNHMPSLLQVRDTRRSRKRCSIGALLRHIRPIQSECDSCLLAIRSRGSQSEANCYTSPLGSTACVAAAGRRCSQTAVTMRRLSDAPRLLVLLALARAFHRPLRSRNWLRPGGPRVLARR